MVAGKSKNALFAALVAALLIALSAPMASAGVPPGAPTGLKAGLPSSSNGGCVKLTWRVASPGSLSGYKVYRSTDAGAGFAAVYEDATDTLLNDMQFVDTGLKDDSRYYYRVTVLGKDGAESRPSNTVSAVPKASGEKAGAGYGKQIIISIADQRVYFLENNVLIKSHLVSTGTYDHPTPIGTFSIGYHEYCAISVKYGGVYMYYWMYFAPDTGMHALPYDPKSGTWTSASCLGTRASHGCVRQALQDAKWAYDWTPNGTRLDVIAQHFTYTPPPPPYTGGHASQGISSLSKDWYFAEGYTAPNFNEFICMMNPLSTTATVQATYMKPDGSVAAASYSVPAFSRSTINLKDVPGLQSTEVSVRLSSDIDISAERSQYFWEYKGKDGGTDSAGVSLPGKTWYLAEGYTGGDFDEYVLMQNPGPMPASVHIEFMTPDGSTVDRYYNMNPTSRMSVHVDDMPELSQTDVSCKITSDQDIVVERSQYFNYYGREDGNASAAVKAPGKTWYLAEGYTGGEFDEYVLIQNPNELACTATVTFMCTDGFNLVKSYNLLPKSRFTIHVDDIPELASRELSTKVVASRDVIVERAEYFVSYGRTGGSDAPGVQAPANYWYLAEGFTGGDFDTFVLIMNPNSTAVNVDVNYLLPGGGIKAANYNIGPNSRYTIHVDSIEGLTNTEFSTALTGSKPVICERAMYFRIPRALE